MCGSDPALHSGQVAIFVLGLAITMIFAAPISTPSTARPAGVSVAVCGAPHNVEVGAVWPKRFGEGRDYLSVKLDDPSFNAPIYANLFDDKDAETYTLIWSRSRKPNGD